MVLHPSDAFWNGTSNPSQKACGMGDADIRLYNSTMPDMRGTGILSGSELVLSAMALRADSTMAAKSALDVVGME